MISTQLRYLNCWMEKAYSLGRLPNLTRALPGLKLCSSFAHLVILQETHRVPLCQAYLYYSLRQWEKQTTYTWAASEYSLLANASLSLYMTWLPMEYQCRRPHNYGLLSFPTSSTHAQLLEKLRPITLAEKCSFLAIHSLEFREIWHKNRSETA